MSDPSVVVDLETAVADWTQQIQRVAQHEMGKAPTGKGPLAEIEFWRSRSASLSTLYEQLHLPHVKKVFQSPMAQGRSTKVISQIQWIRTSRLSIKPFLSLKKVRTSPLNPEPYTSNPAPCRVWP